MKIVILRNPCALRHTSDDEKGRPVLSSRAKPNGLATVGMTPEAPTCRPCLPHMSIFEGACDVSYPLPVRPGRSFDFGCKACPGREEQPAGASSFRRKDRLLACHHPGRARHHGPRPGPSRPTPRPTMVPRPPIRSQPFQNDSGDMSPRTFVTPYAWCPRALPGSAWPTPLLVGGSPRVRS